MTSMHSRLDWVTWPLSFQPPPHKGGSSLVDASPLYSNESASTNTRLLFDHAPSNPQGKLSIPFIGCAAATLPLLSMVRMMPMGPEERGCGGARGNGIYTVAVSAHRDI